MEQFLVTTLDNPFNPFTQFDDWNRYDQAKGYNTNSYLARIAKTSPELSEEEQTKAINQAVNEIVRLNILGIYKRVERSSSNSAETAQNAHAIAISTPHPPIGGGLAK